MTITLESALVLTPDVCGGQLRIAGTRITVSRIVTLYKQGLSIDEIVQTYPNLNYAQVHVALAYYHENQTAVEAELRERDAEYDILKKQFQAQ